MDTIGILIDGLYCTLTVSVYVSDVQYTEKLSTLQYFFSTDIVSNLNIFITEINIYHNFFYSQYFATIFNILSNILVIYNFWCVIVQSR